MDGTRHEALSVIITRSTLMPRQANEQADQRAFTAETLVRTVC
jgi:hypothetical protein